MSGLGGAPIFLLLRLGVGGPGVVRISGLRV